MRIGSCQDPLLSDTHSNALLHLPLLDYPTHPTYQSFHPSILPSIFLNHHVVIPLFPFSFRSLSNS